MSDQYGSLERSKPQTVETFQDVWSAVSRMVTQASQAPCVVLVGGCSCSGKTWLSTRLCRQIEEIGLPALQVSLDAWLLSVDERPASSTVLQRFECPAIVRAVCDLVQGRPVSPPVYDAVSRRRVARQGPRALQILTGFLLVDGVVSLAIPELRELSSFNLYVSISDPIRLGRLQEFYRTVKGLGEEADLIIMERESEEVPFIVQTKQWADLIFEPRG